MPEQITARQWNRTLLQRQYLLDRADEDAVDILDRCVGLQAQDPKAPFFGLWSRIADFQPDELDDLLTGREVVRMALLRATVFCMDTEDARWVRAVTQPVLDAGMAPYIRRLADQTAVPAVIDDARALLSEAALSSAHLGRMLAERHPSNDPSTLVGIARHGLPLVQIPPRGLWRGSGAPTYRLFDDWAGPGDPALTGDEARMDLIRLYLRGFGPSTISGIQTWCGLTKLRPLIRRLVDDWELVELAGPDGEYLVDLEGLDIADADLPAPVRLIAPFDNVIVAQADRRRIVDEDRYRALRTPNGLLPGFILVDGRLAGSWTLQSGQVRTELLTEIDPAARAELDTEIERLQRFCAS